MSKEARVLEWIVGLLRDLGGADDASFFDRSRGVWEPVTIDFDSSVACRVFDIEIPVMPFDELVAYKRALDREVDRRDLEEMEPR